jgi:Sec-independent protein translocase protein TatA
MKWLILIAALLFTLFYYRKLPDFARSLAKSVKAFREGKNESITPKTSSGEETTTQMP